MRREHPRGAVRHVGAQMRYLLVSEHGVLGALGFAAAALALAARDWCAPLGVAEHEFGGAADVRLRRARIQSEAPAKLFPGLAQN